MNPLVQPSIQVRREVRQVMREGCMQGSSLARLMLLEGISHHGKREFSFLIEPHSNTSPWTGQDRTEGRWRPWPHFSIQRLSWQIPGRCP